MTARMSFGNWASTGLVGSSFAPFVPGGEGLLLQNMRMKLAQDRLDDEAGEVGGADGLLEVGDRAGGGLGAGRGAGREPEEEDAHWGLEEMSTSI